MSDLTDTFTSNRSTLDTLLASDWSILNPTLAQPSTLFKIIRNTSIIYRGAFLLPSTPISSSLNYPFVTSIVALLSSSDYDDTWVCFPGILLWIMLTGTVAASNHPEQTFFKQFFAEIVSAARWSWWDEIIGAFEKFFKIRSIADEMCG